MLPSSPNAGEPENVLPGDPWKRHATAPVDVSNAKMLMFVSAEKYTKDPSDDSAGEPRNSLAESGKHIAQSFVPVAASSETVQPS